MSFLCRMIPLLLPKVLSVTSIAFGRLQRQSTEKYSDGVRRRKQRPWPANLAAGLIVSTSLRRYLSTSGEDFPCKRKLAMVFV